MEVVECEFAEEGGQWWIALSCAVLQRSGDVYTVEFIRFGGIVWYKQMRRSRIMLLVTGLELGLLFRRTNS